MTGLTAGFWRDRRVLITGHTGFKGAWLALWLEKLGARISGIALAPDSNPSLYQLAAPWAGQDHLTLDIRDKAAVKDAVRKAAPEIVFHMAAQPLVRASYRDPIGTYETNFMGTLHVLDAVRETKSVKAVVAITTDKVYENENTGRAFVESDRIGGGDPYSNSKAVMELATSAFAGAFFKHGPALATVRAGNVVGGGDWAADRLIPDVVRALTNNAPLLLRYPKSTRPWQHVLEPLRGYLMLAEQLVISPATAPKALNFGPAAGASAAVADVVEILAEAFKAPVQWRQAPGEHPEEAVQLALDSSLAKKTLGWAPKLDMRGTIAWTADWYSGWRNGADARKLCLDQIARYETLNT